MRRHLFCFLLLACAWIFTFLEPDNARAAQADGTVEDGTGKHGTGGGGGNNPGNDPGLEPGNAENCNLGILYPSEINRVIANGDDLMVTVDWSTDPALPVNAGIRLEDDAGTTVALVFVPTSPGQRSDHLLIGVLVNAPADGFQYHVTVEDPGGNPISEKRPSRVFLDCGPGGASCDHLVNDRLHAGSLVTSEALMNAMDAATGLGSSDLLADALLIEPTLVSDVRSLAWQLDVLDLAVGLPPGQCACAWLPAIAETLQPAPFLINDQPVPPHPSHNAKGYSGPGAGYALGAQSITASPTYTHGPGESRLTMDLRCFQVLGWRTVPVDLDTTPARHIEIREPILAPCVDDDCNPTIAQQSELRGVLEIEAWADTDQANARADAQATADATYSVGQSALYAAFSTTAVDTAGGQSATDLVCTYKSADYEAQAARLSAALVTQSSIGVGSNAGAWGMAMSRIFFWLEATGTDACAVEPQVRAVLIDSRKGEKDGILIQPWGPPPPPA